MSQVPTHDESLTREEYAAEIRRVMKRSDERAQPSCDLYAPLSPDEFECLRQFASEFGDSLVLDKPMPRFPHLKKLVELGFIGREGEEYYVTRFARMRINQGH